MKKLLCLLMALALITILSPFAAAEESGTAASAYASLKRGDNNVHVRDMQLRLMQLGFFSGMADGDYGDMTEQAVLEFETYIAYLEKLEICGADAIMGGDATPADASAPIPEAAAGTAGEPVFMIDVNNVQGSIVPDGIADAMIMDAMFDDDLDLFITEVRHGSKNLDTVRVQRRLNALNYLKDVVDGAFGLNSDAALRKFQRMNGLDETGETDSQTRALLYSSNAVMSDKPIYNYLSLGSEGDVVRAFQERMTMLGFSSSNADGVYGSTSARNVKGLQEYMFLLENPMSDMSAVAYINPTDVYDAEKRGFVSDGFADHDLIEIMVEGKFQIFKEELRKGSANIPEIKRVQRRLYALLYMAGTNVADGDFGNATETALREFQNRNGLPETGIADETTQLLLFSENASRALKPYLLRVSVKDQKVMVYKPDANEDFTILYKTFICSTGKNETPTPLGTFSHTSPGTNEWHFFSEFNSWAHYPFYIEGNIMFHSVLFNEKDNDSSLQTGTLRNLGKKASHGCIRLRVEDAKWIYQNCPKRTTVLIY